MTEVNVVLSDEHLFKHRFFDVPELFKLTAVKADEVVEIAEVGADCLLFGGILRYRQRYISQTVKMSVIPCWLNIVD